MMSSRSNSLCVLALTVAATFVLGPSASAQTYPNKPIRVIVGFAAGSSSDIVPRVVLGKAAQFLNNATIVVENMPGAGGNTGAGVIARSDPDGYKIGASASGPLAVNKILHKNLGYDPETDFEPISTMTFNPNVLVVSTKAPFQTLNELVAYAKANPDVVTYSTVGVGSSAHMGGLLFDHLNGVKMRHLPYRVTAQLVTDLITGQVPLSVQNIINVLEQHRAGKVKILAIAARARHPTIPDVPTAAEFGMPDFLSHSWFALVAPKGTPKPIVDTLNQATVAALADPEVVQRLTAIGAIPTPMKADEFKAFIPSEIKIWREILAKVGIEPL